MIEIFIYPRYQCVLILSILLFMTACGSTRIFHADFNADRIGALPAEFPPTEPEEDRIWTSALGNTEIVQVVNRPPFTTPSLQCTNADVISTVAFVSRPAPLERNQTFWAYWLGSIDLDPDGSGLSFSLTNSNRPIAGLRFKNGRVELQTSSMPERYEPIGSYKERKVHMIIFEINKASQTYKLMMLQPESNVISLDSGERTVLNAEAMEISYPSLYMQFYEPITGAGYYLIDDITITEKRPDIPETGS